MKARHHSRKYNVIAILCCGILLPTVWAQSKIEQTKHNLTSTGPGPIRVTGESRICIFCHTPHAASPVAPLWNREDLGTYYETYESTTLEAQVGQPTGSSRLCLSCHDGTIALTQTYNPRNAPEGASVYITPEASGYIGTDLRDDHPISFTYDASLAARQGQLRAPATLPPELPLDHNQQVQCTTCHDPHDNAFGDFLRMSNTQSQMCRTCHAIEGWETSVHANAGAALDMARSDVWNNIDATTVRDAACESCHRPHSAGGHQRLLRHEAEEANCLSCHDGSVATADVQSELTKFSVHPVLKTTGVHDPTEDPFSMREHVECADCHAPHQMAQGPDTHPPFIKPTMKGTSGVDSSGVMLEEAVYEYEVCYKCHATRNVSETPLVNRYEGTNDMSEAFSPVNMSYHPVEVQGMNSSVPSLRQPLNPTTMIYCTDCHGSDSGDALTGASGPHGSRYRPLLVSNYSVQDNTPESPQAYELCYNCHNRSSILANESFSLHRRHIVDENTPCSVCHDPHGVRTNTNLINYDRNVVEPSQVTGTGPIFEDQGMFRGSCTLRCHGKEHAGLTYPN